MVTIEVRIFLQKGNGLDIGFMAFQKIESYL